MHELTELIKQDMVPALGVTEPGAIAFAVATAGRHTKGALHKVSVALNSGMYKNAYTCGIPNSDSFGNLYAAALGAVAADESLGLNALEHISEEDSQKAGEIIRAGMVEVSMDHMGSRIYIDARVETSEDTCTVSVRDTHTDIRCIELNGNIIYGEPMLSGSGEDGFGGAVPVIHRYALHDILTYVSKVPAEEIGFVREAFSMNLELLNEGLESKRTVIGPMLRKENGGKLISQDAKGTAQLLCNGAIEARVLGLGKPAMSITGSGAHGIIATLPLYAYYKSVLASEDEAVLLRAVLLSYLITMYIKEYSGRLSAFCGCGIAAGTGMACGLAYMRGADEAAVTMVIQNMASGLTGMICDGGNQGCAMKGMVAVDAAFRAADMAMQGVCIHHIHGINGNTPEDTMRNMGRIASPGMEMTEEVIVGIMQDK